MVLVRALRAPWLHSRTGKHLRRLDLHTALTVTAAFCLAATLWGAYLRALVPFVMNYGEGNVLSAGLRVLSGTTPYPDPAGFPYTLNPYGPIG